MEFGIGQPRHRATDLARDGLLRGGGKQRTVAPASVFGMDNQFGYRVPAGLIDLEVPDNLAMSGSRRRMGQPRLVGSQAKQKLLAQRPHPVRGLRAVGDGSNRGLLVERERADTKGTGRAHASIVSPVATRRERRVEVSGNLRQ
jgi:hypothetical protein